MILSLFVLTRDELICRKFINCFVEYNFIGIHGISIHAVFGIYLTLFTWVYRPRLKLGLHYLKTSQSFQTHL